MFPRSSLYSRSIPTTLCSAVPLPADGLLLLPTVPLQDTPYHVVFVDSLVSPPQGSVCVCARMCVTTNTGTGGNTQYVTISRSTSGEPVRPPQPFVPAQFFV